MATLEQLLAQRDALEDARASGVLSASYTQGDGAKTVNYRSVAELTQAIGCLNRRIAALQGSGPVQMIRIASSKGT